MVSGGACMECDCGEMGNFLECPKCGRRMTWANFDESKEEHHEPPNEPVGMIEDDDEEDVD